MKTSLPGWMTVLAVAVCGFISTTSLAQSQTNKLRVGVYDSRAIAIAYGNSAEFKASLKSLQAEYDKAKADKNEKRMKELDAQGRLSQRRAHEQAFSTGSVAGPMSKIKDSLPAVAKQANVQIIVSKWELNHQSADVETVDVTDELVALFHPSEKALGWIKSSREQKPVPIEKITDDVD